MRQQSSTLVQTHVTYPRITDVGVIGSEQRKQTIKGSSNMCMPAERRAFHNRLQVQGANQRAGLGSKGIDWLLMGPVVMMMMMVMGNQAQCYAEITLPRRILTPYAWTRGRCVHFFSFFLFFLIYDIGRRLFPLWLHFAEISGLCRFRELLGLLKRVGTLDSADEASAR